MSLVKWLRKNNTKIMAVVVIVLMVGFIGGSSLTYILRGTGGAGKAVAYYGHKQKITYYDRAIATQELEILAALRADQILRGSQDLQSLLLSELLFSQNRSSGAMTDMVKQIIQRNRYRISDEQLSSMYKGRTVPSDMYWILLRKEAQSAGIHVGPQDVGGWLGRLISQYPQVFGSGSYTQVMQSLVGRFKQTEPQILGTLGELLAVLQYAQIVTSMENVTTSQVQHMASQRGEMLDIEFVQFETSDFADKEQTPDETAILEQFNRYKANRPGEVSEANPFGFGYRLPNRVQLETIALKLEAVASIVKPPTEEDAEQYYRENRERLYTQQVPSDPNDPNSPLVPQTKSYAEVADSIMGQLRRQRITTQAELILQDARNLADTGLQPTDAEGQKLTVEQRKERAGDYEKIARDLSDKHGIPIYYDRTGLLSAMDLQADTYLRRMYLTGYGYSPVPLIQVLFSVAEFGADATIMLSVPQAEMYMSIGPARDPMAASAVELSGQIMLLSRVVDAREDAAPESLDVTYSTKMLSLGETEQKDAAFSLREQVAEDVRKLAAWETTRTRAGEFMAMAKADGWDKAIAKFNELYGEQAKADPNDPNAFALDRMPSLQRISNVEFQVLAAQVANNPGAKQFLNEARMESQLIDRLYALAPTDDGAAAKLPAILEFKPNQSCYVLKNLSIERMDRQQFQRMKGMLLRQEDYGQAQSLAVVHLNPENILKRMNFRLARQADEPAEAQAEQQQEDAS